MDWGASYKKEYTPSPGNTDEIQRGGTIHKIIFFNITCMKRYQGITEDDKPMHGGAFVKKRGYGGEIYNFQPFGDKMYGFVEAGWRPQPKCINIKKLGARRSDKLISGVLVIWVAKQSRGKHTLVVGWYKDATVYKKRQKPPVGSNRKQPNGQNALYFVEADKKNCLLIPWDVRDFQIRRGREAIGQSNIYHADSRYGTKVKAHVLEYIAKWERQRRLAVRLE